MEEPWLARAEFDADGADRVPVGGDFGTDFLPLLCSRGRSLPCRLGYRGAHLLSDRARGPGIAHRDRLALALVVSSSDFRPNLAVWRQASIRQIPRRRQMPVFIPRPPVGVTMHGVARGGEVRPVGEHSATNTAPAVHG